MDMTMLGQILNLGTPVAVLVFLGWFLSKYAPKFIEAWQQLCESINNNTEVTKRQYDSTVTVAEQLREVVRRLDRYAQDVQLRAAEHIEIINLLKTIREMIDRPAA